MQTSIGGSLGKIECAMGHCDAIWFLVNPLTSTFRVLVLPWLIQIEK